LLALITAVFAIDKFSEFKNKCHVDFESKNGKIVVKDVVCDEKSFLMEEKMTEETKCIFNNSITEQECYSEFGGCKGINGCYVKIDGTKDQNITWKSSCGGYAYTIMDSKIEEVVFDCVSQEYLNAKWECYDGLILKGENKIALDSNTWRGYADQSCENHCDTEKCGVMYFEVI